LDTNQGSLVPALRTPSFSSLNPSSLFIYSKTQSFVSDTLDLVGIEFSPNGRYLCVWDTPAEVSFFFFLFLSFSFFFSSLAFFSVLFFYSLFFSATRGTFSRWKKEERNKKELINAV